MNLISETHHFCERREYAFNVLPEYYIITQEKDHSFANYKQESKN